MDAVEYELLSRLAAGGAVFRPGEPGASGAGGFHYTVGRLLQLRARGLIRFADEWAHDYNAVGPCLLTTAGRRALQQQRGTSVTLESPPRRTRAEGAIKGAVVSGEPEEAG